MYSRDELPRRPSIPLTFYALMAVILSERLTLRVGRGWFAGAAGFAMGVLCIVLLAGTIVARIRSCAMAGLFAVFGMGLLTGCALATLTIRAGNEFVCGAEKSAVSAWEFRIRSEPTASGSKYRCRATMCQEGFACGDVWLFSSERMDMGAAYRCVGRFEKNDEDDWGISSRMQGVWGSVRVTRITLCSSPQGTLNLIMNLRSNLLESISPGSSEERALLAGCVCGSREGLKAFMIDKRFSECGISHLIAVSGSHLSIFCALCGTLLSRLRIPHRLRIVLLIVASGTFVLFCGIPSSAVRAWVMTSVAMMGELFGRRSHGLSGVSIAGLAMASLEPTVTGSVGFLLSVSSVCGLCLFSAYASYVLGVMFGRHGLPRFLPRFVVGRIRGLLDALKESLAASTVALFATMPVVVGTFGEISLVGPIVNALVSLPFMALVSLGMVSTLFLGIPILHQPLLVACDVCASCILWIVDWFLGLPVCSVSTAKHATLIQVGALALAAILLVAWPRIRRKGVAIVLTVTAALTCGTYIGWRCFAPAHVCVLDVGQGDAILVQDGAASLLVDTGPDEAIVDALARNHVFHLNAVVITHLHDDHYAGLEELVGHVACDHVFVGKGVAGNVPSSMREACKSLTGRDVEEIDYGDTVRVGAFDARVVWPQVQTSGTQNEDSIIMTLSYSRDKRTLEGLLTGDAEQEQLQSVLVAGDVGDLDFLKAGHHGSSVSILSAQAKVLDPEVSVASAGEGNRYGHPSDQCKDALESAGSEFLCTKDVGDVDVIPGEEGPTVICENR